MMETFEELEAGLSEMTQQDLDQVPEVQNYDNYIALKRNDVSRFCRIIEPLLKSSIDDYGKGVLVNPKDVRTVELCYYNTPYYVSLSCENKSGKTIKPFVILFSTLKKIATNSYGSVLFVEDNDAINIALAGDLLFVETMSLDKELYNRPKKDTPNNLDLDMSKYVFVNLSSILDCTDRAPEKVIVVKGENTYFNTGVFSAKAVNPFGNTEQFLLYKVVSELLENAVTTTNTYCKWGISEETLCIDSDGILYIECPITTGEKVSQFLSPVADQLLSFNPSIQILDVGLHTLISTIKNLDYLSDIVTIQFTTSDMEIHISSTDHSKSSIYKFKIVEGKPEVSEPLKLSVDVLLTFLKIVGSEIQFAYVEGGLGIKNQYGIYLLRR